MAKPPRQLTLADLAKANSDSIARAGPRYTPSQDPDAPNLRIAQLSEALDALSHSVEFKDRLRELEAALRDAWTKCPQNIRTQLASQAASSHLGADLLQELVAGGPGGSAAVQSALSKTADECRNAIFAVEETLYDELQKHPKDSEERKRVQASIEAMRELRAPVSRLTDFLQSPAFALIYKNALFIRGEWGSGKTHLVCDVARMRSDEGLPVLLFLAHALPAGKSPLSGACQVLGADISARQLIAELDRLGRASGSRALLIFDGINEADRRAWRQNIEPLLALVGRYQYVGLVLTCRTPFDQQVLTDKAKGALVSARHFGFEDIEFDAQSEFFRYYKIPTPHVPLLATEFSRPLFLKILCSTISTLGQAAKSKRVRSFASGHKGMTKLLEDFVVTVGGAIEKAHGLQPKMCWYLLKGRGDGKAAMGLAPLMAERGEDFLPEADCLRLIMKVCALTKARSRALLRSMVAEGLLAEEVVYADKEWRPVIRLPYQRFSDHLISRHLLGRYLDTSSAKAIRACFRPSKPLGRIFKLDRWGHEFAMPGLATAVMLEFPERVKRAVHEDKQELVHYLPKKARTTRLSTPFIEGLLWRSSDSFTSQTDRLVNVFLHASHRHVQEEMLDALVGLATRTAHPYSADRLYDYLSNETLQQRELFWTDFLRTREPSSPVHRVLDWVLSPLHVSMDERTGENLIALISLILTSTNRPLRDRATRCLVVLGDRFPSLLYGHAQRALSFNDPYVPERMLAASYGVLMRRWSKASPEMIASAVNFAGELRKRLVGSKTAAPIEHILMRDYARGFVDLTIRLAPERAKELSIDERQTSAKSGIPSASRIKKAVVEQAKGAIRMDFGNYTIGHLVEGRQNYDYNHPGYRKVLKQISWRILDLGYAETRFKDIDRTIAESRFHRGRGEDPGREDRYGKKFGWIAYFEVAGRLQIRGELGERSDPRIPDIDIDPSFPDMPKEWIPSRPSLFDVPYAAPHEWLSEGSTPDYSELLMPARVDGVQGPWAVLEGFIMESSSNDPRQTFTFLRGLIVPSRNLPRLEELISTRSYPGNSALPEPGTDHYLFAGEIGWSTMFGFHLRKGGKALPHIEEAFSSTEYVREVKRYGELTPSEKRRYLPPVVFRTESGGIVFGKGPEPRPDKLVELTHSRHIPGVPIEVPVRKFGWESYHSRENDAGNPDYPSPAVVEALGLRKSGGAIDLVDDAGKTATLYRSWRLKDRGWNSDLLYLRRDLLDRYLSRRRSKLVWVTWGEREFDHELAERIRVDDEAQAVWSEHAHIHKRMYVYDKGRPGGVRELAISRSSVEVDEQ